MAVLSQGIAWLALLAAGTDVQPVGEYQVKAAFLYNFAKFVEWPGSAFKSANEPVTICVLGRNPFGNTLEDAVAGKVVEGRTFAVRQISGMQGAGGCRILFVSGSERKQFRAGAASIAGQGLLTVGEWKEFIADGGVVNFKLESGKVRFEINVAAAERENLRISSKLLSLADVARK
jgi:hypothetical protein